MTQVKMTSEEIREILDTLLTLAVCVSDFIHDCKMLLAAQKAGKHSVHLNPLNEAMKMSEEVVCRCTLGRRQTDGRIRTGI